MLERCNLFIELYIKDLVKQQIRDLFIYLLISNACILRQIKQRLYLE